MLEDKIDELTNAITLLTNEIKSLGEHNVKCDVKETVKEEVVIDEYEGPMTEVELLEYLLAIVRNKPENKQRIQDIIFEITGQKNISGVTIDQIKAIVSKVNQVIVTGEV